MELRRTDNGVNGAEVVRARGVRTAPCMRITAARVRGALGVLPREVTGCRGRSILRIEGSAISSAHATRLCAGYSKCRSSALSPLARCDGQPGLGACSLGLRLAHCISSKHNTLRRKPLSTVRPLSEKPARHDNDDRPRARPPARRARRAKPPRIRPPPPRARRACGPTRTGS